MNIYYIKFIKALDVSDEDFLVGNYNSFLQVIWEIRQIELSEIIINIKLQVWILRERLGMKNPEFFDK